jgi:succinate dehydrogenase/fumarate reductase flavoprotein subunit
MLEDDLPLISAEAHSAALTTMTRQEDYLVDVLVHHLQKAMWVHAGLLREEASLKQGLAAQAECEAALTRFAQQGKGSRRLSEAQALCSVSGAILRSALARTESRGAHFRNDFPRRDDERFRKHSVVGREGGAKFEEW